MELKSVSHFQKVMEEEEEFRGRLDTAHCISSKRYSSVYILHIKHMLSVENSYLFFVKLQGSDKLMKGQQEE